MENGTTLRLCTARLPYLQLNTNGLEAGKYITLNKELFPMHYSDSFDEKEISVKE